MCSRSGRPGAGPPCPSRPPAPSRWCPPRSCRSRRAPAMRAWVIRGTGGLDQLQPADVPDLAGPLEARQVRIALRAAALNHLDLFVVRGLPHEYRYPHILGADGAGVVEAVGAQVRSVRPGDRVMINPGIPDYSCAYCRAGEHSLCLNYGILGEHLPGTLAQAIVVPEQNVAVIPTLPTPLTWAEAAAFSLVTLTAWRMIVTRAQVRRGDVGRVTPLARARRALRELRWDDGAQGRVRHPPAVLVSVEPYGVHHGKRRRVSRDRARTRRGRVAADHRSGVLVR